MALGTLSEACVTQGSFPYPSPHIPMTAKGLLLEPVQREQPSAFLFLLHIYGL